MSANCIQNPVLVHLRPNKQRPVSAGLFVSSLWLIFHCSLISSSVLPIEISIHCESWQGRPALFQLYFFPRWKSHTVINEASATSFFFFALKEVGVDKVPGGLYGAGWLTKWSTWLARERLWSWMRCRKKKRQKTTANFHCDSRPLQSLLSLRDTGKTWISEKGAVENGSMMWHLELLFGADSRSDTDKWSTYGSLVTLMLNNDGNSSQINHYYCVDTQS